MLIGPFHWLLRALFKAYAVSLCHKNGSFADSSPASSPQKVDPEVAASSSAATHELSDDDEEKEEVDEGEDPDSPSDVKENIKLKFLVEMPDDFYHFWEFAKSINSLKPLGTHVHVMYWCKF